MKRSLARLLLAVVASGMAIGHTPVCGQPRLSHATPGALAPGKTAELTLAGAKLVGPVHVWTSFPAVVSVISQEAKADSRLRCKVTVAAQVPPGIGGIAVATAAGLSEVLYVMIDDLPSMADSDGNANLASPLDVLLPVAIDGASGGTLADYFRFSANAGEQVSCEVVANRLGWDFDPLVRVLDAAGHELLLADDDAASGVDPRFVFTAPADGQYVLELRDNRYKPGGRYRLRLGDFPLVTTPFPLVVQRNSPSDVAFVGTGTRDVLLQKMSIFSGDVTNTAAAIGIQPVTGNASGWATLGVTDLPVHREGQPGTPIDKLPSLELPCVVSGVLGRPGEQDRWKFTAAKGSPLRFRASSRSLGSAAVLSLRLTDAGGKQVAASPVTESDEPVLSFTAASDGQYVLVVEELAGRGGVDFGYAVECRSSPQFSLALKNDKNNRLQYPVPGGGAFYLDVQCQRFGYDGPIGLSVDSPHSGWQTFNNVIAPKSNETRMYVQPPATFEAGELVDFRVVGRGKTGDQAAGIARMTTTVQLRTARPHFPYPPAWHDGTIFVSGMNLKPAFFAVTSPSSADFDSTAHQAKLTIEFERLDPKFKDASLTVIPVGLPTGVTAEVKRNGNGTKETYDVLLKGPKDLAPGQHTFRYFAYAELGGEGRGFYSGDVCLNVAAPDADTQDKAAAP